MGSPESLIVRGVDMPLLARAIGLGFTIAAAVGPISLLTIRRTLAHGQLYGLVSGMGVALADASYAAIAAFGLTAITSVLVGGRAVLGAVGGAVLVGLGARTFMAQPSAVFRDSGRPGLAAAFASIYGLTMTNPMTILSFAAVFAALGLSGGTFLEAATLTLGVLVGSALWWVVLTTVVGLVRTRTTPNALVWVNRLSGAIITAFGLFAIVTVVRGG